MTGTLAQEVVARLRAANLVLATAESCTGGMIAASITDVPGSSAVFDRGFVTYSNDAKIQMLGVPLRLIEAQGAVSEQVAAAMAAGALAHSGAGMAVSVTGIAGPDGGTLEKPVGLVWFGIAGRDATHTIAKIFEGDRARIRSSAVQFMLHLLLEKL